MQYLYLYLYIFIYQVSYFYFLVKLLFMLSAGKGFTGKTNTHVHACMWWAVSVLLLSPKVVPYICELVHVNINSI